MFFSRCLMVVFKTSGGRAWNPPGGLRPLSPCQRRNRRRNVSLTLKNLSVLKLAEAHQPAVPVRLYKPLNFTRMQWMKKKLEEARTALGGESEKVALVQRARALLPSLRSGPASVGVGLGAGAGGHGSLLPQAARAALWEGQQAQR